MKNALSAACAVAMMVVGMMMLVPNAQAAEAMSACSSIEITNPGCCACNEGTPIGACISVLHNGVASCTFEFCSGNNCTYQ
jgi:hypothetical protein